MGGIVIDAERTEADPTLAAAPRPAAPGRRDRRMAAALAGLAFAVYAGSLVPGVGPTGDAAKWQLVSAVGGVPHGSGYPLYIALIQAFESLVPFGSAAWTTNLFSALCGAAAVAVLFGFLRLLDLRWSVAAATAATFALTGEFWSQAVMAEVYTLHILFVVSILACLARWRLGGENRWLLAGLGLLTVSFGHHMTSVLLLPGVAWLVWSDRRRALTPTNVAWTALFAVLSASQYLYLFYMNDVGGYVEYPVADLHDLWFTVSGQQFRNHLGIFTLREVISERLPLLADRTGRQYGLLLLPIAWGLARGLGLRGRNRDIGVALALIGAGSALYGINYDVSDVAVFFLPLFLVLAVFLGLGLDAVVDGVERYRPDHRRAVVGATAGLLALPLATGLAARGAVADRRGTAHAEQIERAVEAAGQHAVLLSRGYHDTTFLWYFVLGEGMGESRGLAVVHEATPQLVEAYFARGEGPVADAAAEIEIDDPPLYTASPRHPEEMAEAGFEVTEVAEGVWRIDPGD